EPLVSLSARIGDQILLATALDGIKIANGQGPLIIGGCGERPVQAFGKLLGQKQKSQLQLQIEGGSAGPQGSQVIQNGPAPVGNIAAPPSQGIALRKRNHVAKRVVGLRLLLYLCDDVFEQRHGGVKLPLVACASDRGIPLL